MEKFKLRKVTQLVVEVTEESLVGKVLNQEVYHIENNDKLVSADLVKSALEAVKDRAISVNYNIETDTYTAICEKTSLTISTKEIVMNKVTKINYR